MRLPCILSVLSALFILFFYHPKNSIYDSSLISGFFSFAGVILFAVALFYQIKEYKHQVIELKKSVEAQTKSSIAMDEQTKLMQEQKAIMIEQTYDNLLNDNISKFNSFKARVEIQKAIETFYQALRLDFTGEKVEKGKLLNRNQDNYGLSFAKKLYESIDLCLSDKKKYMVHLQKYIAYGHNIFIFIEDCKMDYKKYDWYRSMFHNQFTAQEILVLYLSNLKQWGTPKTAFLRWNYWLVIDLLNALDIMECLKLQNTNIPNDILEYFSEKEYKNLL